jgi:type II secretory pathway component PulC
MKTNKIIIYLLIFIFIVALYATFPKDFRYYYPEVKVNFKNKHTEKITRAERDPFRYKTKKKSIPQNQWKPSSITVKGIIWDKKKPSAAISINNGKTIFVNEGERINHIRILKIEPDRIIIDEYGRRTVSFK